MPAYAQTPKRIRAEAIALVQNGKSRRAVARQLGVTDMTVRDWMDKANSEPNEPGTTRELAEQRSAEMRGDILSGLQDCILDGVREIRAKLPDCTANQAVGIVKLCCEQLATLQGQPSSIQGHVHGTQPALAQAMEDLAQRRAGSIEATAEEVPDEAAAA